MNGTSCLTVEHGEVFGSGEDASALVTIVGVVVSLTDVSIVGSLGYITSCAVDGTWRRLADEFSMSVAVEVVDHELRVMGTGSDILTQIDAPKFRAIQLKAVDDDIASVAVVRVVVCIRRVPLQEQLVLSVTIHIAHRTVVRPVLVGASVGCGAVFGTVQRDGAIEVSPWGYLGRCRHHVIT